MLEICLHPKLRIRSPKPVFIILALAWLTTAAPAGQSRSLPSTATGEWPAYGGDIGHTRYSPLDQIDAANFDQLDVAWRFKTDNLGPVPEFKLEGTPLSLWRRNGRRWRGGHWVRLCRECAGNQT